MLLDARKVPVLERVYARYGRRLLRRSFARIWVGGAPWPPGDGPTIAFLNHSAWWDPILTVYLSHDLFRRDGYGLMQGAQLLKYPFFRRLGCFGASTDSVEDVRGIALYAARTLRGGAGRTLWIFPQGELLPAHAPLAFRSGAARIARAVPEAPLVPVAVRYAFRGSQRAECFVRVGEAVRTDPAERPAALTRRLEQRLRRELEVLDADLARPEVTQYRPALDGAGSLSALYDRTLGRLRA
jgi:1-acyl-sn-glycerol-3-phosphate acyltransferase